MHDNKYMCEVFDMLPTWLLGSVFHYVANHDSNIPCGSNIARVHEFFKFHVRGFIFNFNWNKFVSLFKEPGAF